MADPFKEHTLFNALLYTRITRSSIYEFGPIEIVCAVTPQQYLDFHPISASDKVEDRKIYGVAKLVHWRARIYRHLFQIDRLFEVISRFYFCVLTLQRHLKLVLR